MLNKKNNLKVAKKEQAFIIAELLIVIVIVGIFVALTTSMLTQHQKISHTASVKEDAHNSINQIARTISLTKPVPNNVRIGKGYAELGMGQNEKVYYFNNMSQGDYIESKLRYQIDIKTTGNNQVIAVGGIEESFNGAAMYDGSLCVYVVAVDFNLPPGTLGSSPAYSSGEVAMYGSDMNLSFKDEIKHNSVGTACELFAKDLGF